MIKKIFAAVTSSVLLISSIGSQPVNATAKTMNINVYMATNQTVPYGNTAQIIERWRLCASRVMVKYQGVASINLNFTLKAFQNNALTNCPSSDNLVLLKALCLHCGANECKNYSTLHHSNICNILNSFPDATSNSTSLFITPANLCMVKSNEQHAIYYGATNVNNNKIIVRDYDYDSSGSSYNPDAHTALTYMVCSTIAHEIGHLYNVTDHYNAYYGDERDNCIWGYYHNDYDINRQMKMCDNCKEILKNNSSKFNHT
ncbi:MAG: hypothetical protein U0I40_09760 [Oscillospiraceae bacterium]|nr:hypothetical protein [Oscillospiraceae bacterium]